MNIQTDPGRLKQTAHQFPAPPEEPIRDQFLHEDRLRALGERLARNEIPSLLGMETFEFQKRIRENGATILDVYRSTNAAQARGETVTPAAQWLLDNHYLVEETSYQIKRDLPRRFYRELPTMTLPSVTSTSTSEAATRTLKAVPTARTATPEASTTKGRLESLITVKCASPESSCTFRAVAEKFATNWLSGFSSISEPSASR